MRRTSLALVVLAVVAVASGCGTRTAPKAAAHPSHHRHQAPHRATVAAVTLPAGDTLTATTHGDIPGSPAPGAPSTEVVPGTWYDYPSILPIIDNSNASWVEVRLAQRPNGSVAWVRRTDVTIGLTPYRIVVNLSTEHLTVYENGQQVDDFPAGIGSPSDPTVTGQYFMTMQVPAPNAGYGPFVLVTSAHSDAITDWAASGDAIIAIHGPITSADDAQIGTSGAAISHGCVRLHDADLAQLSAIPAGTPIDIVAS
jgi:lipoprotein-anchoring transpeptidase ErfK/SrfK